MTPFDIQAILYEIIEDGDAYDNLVRIFSNPSSYLDEIRVFIRTGEIDGVLVHPDLEGKGYFLLAPNYFNPDPTVIWNDPYLRDMTDAAISFMVYGVEDPTLADDSQIIEEFYASYQNSIQKDEPGADLELARDIMFKEDIIFNNDAAFSVYIKWYLIRLETFKAGEENGTDPSFDEEDVLQEIIEETENNSNLYDNAVTYQYSQSFLEFLSVAIPEYDPMIASASDEGFRSLAFANNQGTRDSLRSNRFDRIFQRVSDDITALSSDPATAGRILEKMVETGLLDLASRAYEISVFAEKRLSSKNTLIQNANLFVDEDIDISWMMSLIEARDNLQADPIFFSQVIYYFPGLATFLLDAISIIVDYSNNGLGGGNDEQNEELFLRTLQEAFGNGTSEFKLASVYRKELGFTQDRINKALMREKMVQGVVKRSPWRSNTAPDSPDIFHLRLGASNFYVPPVSIDINTSFKTGSLVGGALRQKNSPKFNSGYRETSISLRLFFPNYQEIWGLSFDPGQNIDLSKDFNINFESDSDKVIDKFLSSLRGLVAAFKYSPFLPVKNHYLNSVHGITGVALAGMSITTVPGFPFALAVDLQLLNFNHSPFLPMIKDFNQAIHWGKYRQYMGRAAISLHDYVNESFLLKTNDTKGEDSKPVPDYSHVPGDVANYLIDSGYMTPEEFNQISNTNEVGTSELLSTNVIEEWTNGNHLTLYAPAETQTKLFLPDTSSFRSDQEELMTDVGEAAWEEVLKVFGIDLTNIDEYSQYGVRLSEVINLSRENRYRKSTYDLVLNSIDLIMAPQGSKNQIEQNYKFIIEDFISENNNNLSNDQKEWLREWSEDEAGLNLDQYTDISGIPYRYKGNILEIPAEPGSEEYVNRTISQVKYFFWYVSKDVRGALDYISSVERKNIRNETGVDVDYEKVTQEVSKAFNVAMYERFYKSSTMESLLEAIRLQTGNFTFNEWEVPMIKVDLDPEYVTIDGFQVTLGNNFSKMQVQMQDEPSYQHIGGLDSYIDVKMTINGEAELSKIKRVFDHISALARLEHATGVIGFLGIKNIVTALAGIKYVMPLNYSVSTKPSFPHIYDVSLRLVDFDIFQQKREELSNKQQEELVKTFTTKKNPFLRIKQFWGAFNAYPDLPLSIKDEEGKVVGHLDPDFYFRSFEMFDDDVVNNITTEKPSIQSFIFDQEETTEFTRSVGLIAWAFKDIISGYNGSNMDEIAAAMAEYVIDKNVSRQLTFKAFDTMMSQKEIYFTGSGLDDLDSQWELLTSFINYRVDEDNENNPFFEEVNPGSSYMVGNLGPSSYAMKQSLENALSGAYSLPDEEYVSFDPDTVDFHKILVLVPAMSPEEIAANKASAILITAVGNYFGYVDRNNGRFYLTVNGGNVLIDKDSRTSFKPNPIKDVGVSSTGISEYDPPFSGIGKNLVSYQKEYDGDEYSHWEKMLVDTKYRDISGRMLRAFPTYMLWLIDEGGNFAGVKLFDNFYGLQSIIDFSVVSSEDILGDTLIFRLSNMYSKLTTKESSSIFRPNVDGVNNGDLDLTQGLSNIVGRTLDMARNIMTHMKNEYIVDINNIRLKPGVRVHLRGGYGANPNSLQTLFNGIITNVEQGEIVTVTAQSDAIELSAMVNSTNKKGDSGKIDGGIDTGFWLSEPRDLMVRLLSMGSSRAREAIAHSYNGIIFSENKFGIRHFGTTLYDAMTQQESLMSVGKMDRMKAAFDSAGNGRVLGAAGNFTAYTTDLISRIFLSSSNDIDLELFKRNIYPGNGTGMAQFLAGDIDEGWSTVASITEVGINDRSSDDLATLTDISWNRLLSESQTGGASANLALDRLVSDNELYQSSRGNVVSGILTGVTGAALGGIALAAPVGAIGATVAGGAGASGLLGVMSGRTGSSLWRTLGVISQNPDDDLPGFDEVSFRAQTYMRTVWDMFQVCARLLPNYIVAVRPFEDRSTIFYGKPHWLYTSGVVPITTGYTYDAGPRQRSVNSEVVSLLDQLNSATNPLMDYAAYYANAELNTSIASVADRMTSALNGETEYAVTDSGVTTYNEYSPTSYLANKIIDLNDDDMLKFTDDQGNTICRLPVNRGLVNVGVHLPIGSETSVSSLERVHTQISNLPPRYSFPFFTDVDKFGSTEGSSYYSIIKDDKYKDFEDAFKALKDLENNYLKAEDAYDDLVKQDLIASEGAYLELDEVQLVYSQEFLDAGKYLDDTSKYNSEYLGDNANVYMPLPSMELLEDFYELEDEDDRIKLRNYFESWGAPQSREDEQFYIAMRWPTNIEDLDPAVQESLRAVIGDLDVEISNDPRAGANSTLTNPGVTGTPDDYKQRKVLVYSSETNRAVVCRPAYFLWDKIYTRGHRQVADTGYEHDAIVSPDAAYYLGVLSPVRSSSGTYDDDGTGFSDRPNMKYCHFVFVPDNVPVGVVAHSIAPTNTIGGQNSGKIGFGNFTNDSEVVTVNKDKANDYLSWFTIGGESGAAIDGTSVNGDYTRFGGNVMNLGGQSGEGKGYFNAVFNANYDLIEKDALMTVLSGENANPQNYRGGIAPARRSGSENGYIGGQGSVFAPVYDIFEQEVSVLARAYYDEDFDQNISVIAGDGRTLLEAQDIWDQFRAGYHTYESVKEIFSQVYGLDPDSELDFPDSIRKIITGESSTVIDKFYKSNNGALDELSLILEEDFFNSEVEVYGRVGDNPIGVQSDQRKEAVEFMREAFIDAPISEGGLIESLNNFLVARLKRINTNFFDGSEVRDIFGFQLSIDEGGDALTFAKENVKTPKQLFLLLVGLFRQKLWSDPYARAWLVLRPDRKVMSGTTFERWSFRPVDRVFRAYIDPYNDIAKKEDKWKQLLVSTKGEGNSSSDIFSYAAGSIGGFFEKSVGPIWSALSNGLSGLLNMYKLSMQQMGYAIDQANDFKKHAHILNKALNDSIYYSLGREGSLLRAADNPFTREYGEPVIEIREPFQRIHYINSFSHILSNQIQENISDVATMVTAVSDGKYPVTVALDKGAPAERQVEKTVETGLYFDNMVGEGFFGFLHPLMHPMETIRGVSKNATGTPDELSAKRIALAHLKESIKDIYQGELIVIGNADIRPHDLVYIADVYERIYGLFEVEQVVHHFTSEMGFITSITPNALVTVNDPARWYLTSWMHSWLSTQAIRNDARIYLDSIRDGNSGIVVGGNVSMDRLGEVLGPQITGGLQFTHGSSALVKDAIALEAAKDMPNASEALVSQLRSDNGTAGGAAIGTAAFGAIAGTVAAIATGGSSAVVTAGATAIASTLGGKLAWGGWKWVRDNLLDQHGCYVQYLNKNGQPMDAGLSYNQGMVVGEYHSKAMLPGILGVREKVRTPEGYAYVRTDDLFKSLGWRETEIDSLTRYISLENALVHARVLQLSGLGPERADLEPQFKVIVKVKYFIDGDTVRVTDVLNPANEFTVRFNGINTAETNVIEGKVDYSDPSIGDVWTPDIELLDISTPGGMAKQYVYDKLKDNVFVLRVNKSRSVASLPTSFTSSGIEYDDAGSEWNQQEMYQKGSFERTLGTIFYHFPETMLASAKSRVEAVFRQTIERNSGIFVGVGYDEAGEPVDYGNSLFSYKSAYKESLGSLGSTDSSPVFHIKFDDIYSSIASSASLQNYFTYTNESDPIVQNTTSDDRVVFNTLVYMACLESVYETASRWPSVAWDEYYDDGTPITLNWELVINNLARVYVSDLQKESESVQTSEETTPTIRAVDSSGGYGNSYI